jgi:hypothetical protein
VSVRLEHRGEEKKYTASVIRTWSDIIILRTSECRGAERAAAFIIEVKRKEL